MQRLPLTTRLPTLALLLVGGGAATYAAGRAGGAAAAIPAGIAFLCAAGLYLHRGRMTSDAAFAERMFDVLVLSVPGALTIGLSLQSGGYYPAATALAALALIALLVLRVTLVQDPFAGFTRALAVAVIALGMFAVWTLASAAWSDAPARALVEFSRTLCYLLALVLLGSIQRTPERLRVLVYALVTAIVAVAVIALLTRVFAATFPTSANLGNQQLSHPLGYSNALALLCSLGVVLCLHLTSHLREPAVVRVLAAAALPVLAVTAYFTFSRGGLAAGAIGIVAYVVLGHPRGLLTGALASVPPSVIAIMHAHDMPALAVRDLTTAAASAQGEELALWIVGCVVGAALLRVALCLIDVRLQRVDLPESLRRPVTRSAWAAAALLAVTVTLVADVPGRAVDFGTRFLDGERTERSADIRDTIFSAESSGLPDNWNVALKAFSAEPVRGHGAGAYGLFWARTRPADRRTYNVTDAHSLYFEVLAELGGVGLFLLATVLVLVLVALLPFRRGRQRPVYAALFALTLAWAAGSAAEWNWEMPAVTLWLFGVGGVALAASGTARKSHSPVFEAGPPQTVRVALGVGLFAVAICPALMLVSQHRLDQAVDAYYRGDCSQTIDRATASISVLEMRPEPYEALAYCQLRRGNDALAVRSMEMAVQREPGEWHLHFGLALVRGAAGLDPLPAAREAQRLNPHTPRSAALVKALSESDGARRRSITQYLGVTESLTVPG